METWITIVTAALEKSVWLCETLEKWNLLTGQ